MLAAARHRLGILALIAAAALQLVEPAIAGETKGAAPGDQLIGEWWTENNEGRIHMARYKDGTYRGVTTCCDHKDDKSNRASTSTIPTQRCEPTRPSASC